MKAKFGGEARIFDDLARVAGGAVSILSSVSKQMRSDAFSHINDLAAKMDIPERKEVEHLTALVAKLRLEQEELKERIEALEGGKRPAAKKSAPKKAAAVKSKNKKEKLPKNLKVVKK